MSNVLDTLTAQLELARAEASDAEKQYASAQMTALEAKAAMTTAQRSVAAIERAIEDITGEAQIQVATPEEVAEVAPEPQAHNAGIILPASAGKPGPAVDPNSKAAKEGWIEGPDGRRYAPTEVRPEHDIAKANLQAQTEATAQGTKCGACGKRGTLAQMQHSSGRILTACTACGNQIW